VDGLGFLMDKKREDDDLVLPLRCAAGFQ